MSYHTEYRAEHPDQDYVCRFCGRNVGWWAPGYWKHQTSGTSRPDCNQKAKPITRQEFEQDMAAMAKAATDFMV